MQHLVEYDIEGTEIKHGDRVATIKLNGRARGGDLMIAYVYKPDVTKPASLVISKTDLDSKTPRHYYDMYKRLTHKILILKD